MRDDDGTLSRRAQRMLDEPPFADYLNEHFERSSDVYDVDENPDGYLPLCIAENHLVTDVLMNRLAEVQDVPTSVLGYDLMRGNLGFRRQLATFLGRTLLGRPVEADQLTVLAGAGSVLELVFHALCDPGEGVLVPTPSYSGFWPDLTLRDEAEIVPVHTHADGGFDLTVAELEAALAGAACDVKALLLTNPDNPTGRVMGPDRLDEILTWATQAGLHVVADEVYGLSVFGASDFTSVASLRPRLGGHLHIVWAFSKDFGASGLRCGVLLSENESLLQAVDALAYWAAVSGHTQYLLSEVIADEEWVDGYLAATRSALAAAYTRTSAALDSVSIRHVPADAGFFVLCDLREHLDAPTWESEQRLWRQVLDETGVNLTPGSSFRSVEPGIFRLCFAALPTDAVEEAIRRIGRVLATNRKRSHRREDSDEAHGSDDQ